MCRSAESYELEIKLLRDAAKEAILALAITWVSHHANRSDSASDALTAALAQPADDTALKAALAAEREKCPLYDAADVATKAMRKAWQLGQTYWKQADSESYKQNAKSAITQDAFNDLLDSTADAIRALGD